MVGPGDKKIVAGFGIFLEYLLYYERKEEKGRVFIPPVAQLGGGAFNILKTLQALGVRVPNLNLLGFSSLGKNTQEAALSFLLNQERISSKLLHVKSRILSSYYLIPREGKTWAFGDTGGEMQLGRSDIESVSKTGRESDIKIAVEISANMKEIKVAKILLEKYRSGQISVLVPSGALLRSSNKNTLFKYADLLALNEHESRILFGRNPTRKDILKLDPPLVLITRGPREAWLKVHDKIYTAKPKILKKPLYIGGAGDATVAALIYKLFIQNEYPQTALDFSMEIGRKTLLMPTSYCVKV